MGLDGCDTGDNNIKKYIGEDERMILVDAITNFEGLIEKISYCLKTNQRQSNVNIYTNLEDSFHEIPYEIRNNYNV